MVFRASTEQGPCEWNGCLYRALCGPFSSACPCVVSRGLVQSWGDTTAGHCVLGRRRELPVQRITCLSPFPCHVLSAEGHIGPEPPPPMMTVGVCVHTPTLLQAVVGATLASGVGGTAWLL